jgi:hypothetical protein
VRSPQPPAAEHPHEAVKSCGPSGSQDSLLSKPSRLHAQLEARQVYLVVVDEPGDAQDRIVDDFFINDPAAAGTFAEIDAQPGGITPRHRADGWNDTSPAEPGSVSAGDGREGLAPFTAPTSAACIMTA